MLLLDSGANVNAHGKVDGMTALMVAAATGSASTTFNLLEMGASIDATDKVCACINL